MGNKIPNFFVDNHIYCSNLFLLSFIYIVLLTNWTLVGRSNLFYLFIKYGMREGATGRVFGGRTELINDHTISGKDFFFFFHWWEGLIGEHSF